MEKERADVMKQRTSSLIAFLFTIICIFPSYTEAADVLKEKDSKSKIPSSVVDISKENTYPNSTQDQVTLEPSEWSKEILEGAELTIQNPRLIKMLNETSLRPSPVAIGYRGMIYLGHWPLSYESTETSMNWQYQKVNTNQISNIGGSAAKRINYVQSAEKQIKGGLTSKIDQAADIKKMIVAEAQKNTKLPLSFHTVVGKGTKKDNAYNIPVSKVGTLDAYASAVSEKGTVIFGEVYLELKGSNSRLVVKNVTKQGIGAWIPIQDRLSFMFRLQ